MRGALRLAACVAALAAGAAPAQPRLDNAWLRPASAGQPASVYVDITATEPLTLVGARAPIAARAELVEVDPPGQGDAAQRVVRALPVAAGTPTRLAYLGSHVRLVGLARDVGPGDAVDVELVFRDAAGAERVASVRAVVRGLLPPRRPPPG